MHKDPRGINPYVNGGMHRTPILQQLENVALDDEHDVEIEQNAVARIDNVIDDVVKSMNVH